MTAGVPSPWLLANDSAARLWAALQEAVLLVEQGRPPCAADPERWWPERGDAPGLMEQAVAGCGPCGVVAECRAYAIAAGERYGVWGGLSPAGRRRVAAPPDTTEAS